MSVRDLLDDVADLHTAPLALDPSVALARAAGERGRGLRGPVLATLTGLGVLLAAALVIALVPGQWLGAPRRAPAPVGPGGLPTQLEPPAAWTPSVTQLPLSRVGYVVRVAAPTPGQPASASGLMLMGADSDGYRVVPSGSPDSSVAVSADGALVAWEVAGTTHGTAGALGATSASLADAAGAVGAPQVSVVDVAAGTSGSATLWGSSGQGVDVSSLAFSPDGRSLAIWGRDRDGGAEAAALWLVDVGPRAGGTPRPPELGPARLLCHCAGPGAWSTAGRLLVPAPGEVPPGGGYLPATGSADVGQPVPAPNGGLWVVSVAATGAATDAGPGVGRALAVRLAGARPGAGGVSVGLGDAARAQVLAETPQGPMVVRWGLPSGGSDVVVATPGRLRVVTQAAPTVRVVAVARDVAAGGPLTGAASAGPVSSWWPWAVRQSVSRVLGWAATGGSRVPVLAWVALVVLLPLSRAGRVGAGAAAQRLRGLPVAVVGGRPALRALVLALAVAGALLGAVPPAVQAALDARELGRQHPAGTDAVPLLPSMVGDSPVVPARAFETVGAPVTRSLSMVLDAVVARRRGVYGVDAATGAVVRLDDLPAAAGATYSRAGGRVLVAVSPNGRYVAMVRPGDSSRPDGTGRGGVVVDLAGARARQVYLPAPPGTDPTTKTRVGGTGMAVLDDGTLVVVRAGNAALWVYGPGDSRRELRRFGRVDGVAAATPGEFVVWRRVGPTPATTYRADLVDAVSGKVVGVLPGRRTPPVPVAPLAAGNLVARADDGTLATFGSRGAALGDTVAIDGSVDLLQADGGGGLVAVGRSPAGLLTVLRSSADGRRLVPVVGLGEQVAGVAVAAEVVGAAQQAQASQVPWWAWLAGPWPTRLGFGLLAVALLAGAVWWVGAGLRRRRSALGARTA